jgi:superfamily II DNA/RNA helicase
MGGPGPYPNLEDMTEFSQLGLSPETLAAVAETGYTTATPIQEQAIPVALAGRDVLGIAQTGTGKTAAFTLPMIDRLASGRSKARMPRALVLAPTRELADQVAVQFDKYAKGQKLTWALLIGGVSMGDQVAKLDRGVDVLIATPGRLIDLFERSKVLLTGVQIMVVDEADRMLDMGFIPDLERIFKLTPAAKQTLFFSATMPPEITRLTTQFLKDPTRIEASRPATTGENITQNLARIGSSDPKAKRAALRALIDRADVKNGIIFCNRKTEVDVVAKSLRKHGLDAAPIHGDLDQSLRMKTLADFRSGALRLLVASDVAARGLDIPDVSHVFNYDVPHHADDYVHRIGRTGRAGKSGQTFMIITPADSRGLDKVLKLTGATPTEIDVGIDVSELKTEPRPEREGRSSRSRTRTGGEDRPIRGARAIKAPSGPAEPVQITPETAREIEVETVETVAAEPRRSTRGRTVQPAATPVEAPNAMPQRPLVRSAPAPARPRDDRYPDRDRGDRKVVGFGDDTPAFLARAAPRIAPALAEAD